MIIPTDEGFGPFAMTTRQRAAHGPAMQGAYLESLTAAVGRKMAAHDLADLSSTDQWCEDFAAGVERCRAGEMGTFRQTWPGAQRPRLAARLVDLAEADDPQRPVFVFRRGGQYCGAVVLALATVAGSAMALLSSDGERLAVGAKDASDGLLIARLTEAQAAAEAAAPDVYEVLVWGENWAPLWS